MAGNRFTLPALALGLLVSAAVVEAGDIRRERVAFEKGGTSATLSARIVGDEIVDYLLRARGGQSMTVNLVSDHPAAYFNVIAAGADTALFIGSLRGGYFEGALPVDGDYAVRVYLMRSAARRDEAADCTIDFRIRDRASGAGSPDPTWESGGVTHAAGFIPCSPQEPRLDRECRYRVIRDEGGARVWIDEPNDPEAVWYRLYRFENLPNGRFTTEGETELSWKRQGDDWLVDVGGIEYYKVPDRVIFGCDARGVIRCSFGDRSLDGECGFQVWRSDAGAEIRIEGPARDGDAGGRVLILSGTPPAFDDAVFTIDGGVEMPWERRDDGWLVAVDDREFYFIPEALVLGD